MPHQVGVTFIATVRAEAVESLRALLAAMADDPARNPHVPFGQVDGIHYARFFLLEQTPDLTGTPIDPELFFMADFDAPLEPRLDHLLAVGMSGWTNLFGHCEGFTPGGGARACREFFAGHRVSDAAYYVNTVGLGVDQILLESRLHNRLEEHLDARPGLRSMDADSIASNLGEMVGGVPDLNRALLPEEAPDLGWRIRELAHLAIVPLLGLVLLPVIVVALPFVLLALRIHERSDSESNDRPSAAHIQELEAIEDHGPVNQFTAVGFIKPGWFRTLIARLVLFLIGYGVRHIFNHANLAGVKTIHFARWTFFDGGRRVVFASNYDGSLESYMDDFIDKVAWGLNAVFSNGYGYPATRWLLWGGARKETAFKNFLRVHQAPTQVWYSAYPWLTALNIANNTAIRAGLRSTGHDAQWLARL